MNLEQEAQRRVTQACDLIRSAYRLHTLNPEETISAVKTAITLGAEAQAADVAEDVARV